MIPKIIHQTWKTTTIPEKWKQAADSCKQLHPDFQYILWTDQAMDSFVKQEYPVFYKTYTAYAYHIQRCDAFRYLVLYKYGGVYMDLDMICNKKLDDLLQHEVVIAPSINVGNVFTNSFFMSVPQHPFFKYCIDQLPAHKDTYQYFGKHNHVMSSTGPLFLTNRLKEYGKIKKGRFLSNGEFNGDCSICNETACKGGVYFTHIAGNSWHELDSTLYNFVLCNRTKILAGIVLSGALLLYFRKRRR